MSAPEYLKSLNADYIDSLWEQYKKNPYELDPSWRFFFDGYLYGESESNKNAVDKSALDRQKQEINAEAKVAELIAAYRSSGRLLANINPIEPAPEEHPLLSLEKFGLSSKDLEKKFTAGASLGIGKQSLRQILAFLHNTYCSSIGVEFTHIQDPESREWLRENMEASQNRELIDPETKKFIFHRLAQSEVFEQFIHQKYVAQKRFSLEGGEGLIPLLDRIVESSADSGAEQMVMGMAHRGRLNVLHNTFHKNAEFIFTEFEEAYELSNRKMSGDVKYHQGYSADVETRQGHKLHLSLAHNPSHLEFVNPVVEGIARSKQRAYKEEAFDRVVPVLIHGDAAFSGQGVVYETLNFSQVSGFRNGGTINIVVNNQVGFTTDPESGRSTAYCTDLAKMLQVPVFHVNGDDPEALWYVAGLATRYRQKFKKDVFIDLICYRKYGHNEGDEPSFTQPLMYKKIKKHSSALEQYRNRLLQEGVMSSDEAQSYLQDVREHLSKAQDLTRSEKPKPYSSSYAGKWKNMRPSTSEDIVKFVDTRADEQLLKELAEKLALIPEDFKAHPKLGRFVEARLEAVRSGDGIDWGNAEALAFASLLYENYTVRLTGQDCQRGTFTHRHCVLHDVNNGETHTPLSHISSKQGDFIVRNSTLSEAGVLGFEYGWSLADPDALIVWEAQFGDFANSAQVIIDQFISSSESKWNRACGLVMYLPHGYEGQGPEHSSARLERFLQLCGENNLAVCNLSTPAQHFHALRRQLKRNFRKPLVMMTPKRLLRFGPSFSKLSDLTEHSFQTVLDDPFEKAKDFEKVKRAILCSGKIYYELDQMRRELGRDDVAILRVEQLYPFPDEALHIYLARYGNLQEIVWVQEEPRNMGAWTYIHGYWSGALGEFYRKMPNLKLRYVGRDVAASPATGSQKVFKFDQNRILEEAFASYSEE